MDRAGAANLVPGSLAGDEADESKDFGHGNPGPCFGEANTWHDGVPRALPEVVMHRGAVQWRTEKRNPYKVDTACKRPRTQYDKHIVLYLSMIRSDDADIGDRG